METIKSFFWKPDPAVQLRKCNALIRKNARALDTDLRNLRALEQKTLSAIRTSSKSRHNTPAQTRLLARELIRIRRQTSRVATSKAQLQSVGMQVNEAFGVRKIEGSIKVSTGVMKDVNSLVRLPELRGDMQALSMELMKAGVIEEMAGDILDATAVEEEDEVEDEELDRVLGEVVGKKQVVMPEVPVEVVGAEAGADEEEEEKERREMKEMTDRLMQLKS